MEFFDIISSRTMAVDIVKAKRAAEKLIEQYGIKEPVVPVASIAESNGITIKIRQMPENLKNAAGFFDEEAKTIYVNINDTLTRQNFTIAHELGHYVLEHPATDYGVRIRFPELNAGDDVEKEANCFAANLLVPEEMLRNVMHGYSLTKKDFPILAQMFGVSTIVMNYRLTKV